MHPVGHIGCAAHFRWLLAAQPHTHTHTRVGCWAADGPFVMDLQCNAVALLWLNSVEDPRKPDAT